MPLVLDGGGGSNGNIHIEGQWNTEEKLFAQRNGINFLGLKAGFFVLQAFCTDSAPFMPP